MENSGLIIFVKYKLYNILVSFRFGLLLDISNYCMEDIKLQEG